MARFTRKYRIHATGQDRVCPEVGCMASQLDRQVYGKRIVPAQTSHRPIARAAVAAANGRFALQQTVVRERWWSPWTPLSLEDFA